jgi:1-acyl-sn-glycerol-3-phosphate acyltransferase
LRPSTITGIQSFGLFVIIGQMNPTSLIWLSLLGMAVSLYILRLFLRRDYSVWETMLYLPAYLLGRLLWRVQFLNAAPEEMKRGAVIAANHRSSLDPMFVQLAARRRVHWMVAKEYCQHKVLGLFLKALQVIPTNRSGTDINSTKYAMRYAQQGKLVGMFPEGHINLSSNVLLPIRAGAAMVAVKTNVPIIPLYIKGSPYRGTALSPLFMSARVQIVFGKPVYPDGNDAAQPTAAPEPTSEAASNGIVSGNSNSQAVELITRWGNEIARISGHPDFKVQVGSSVRRRHRRENSQTQAASEND